MPLNDPWTTAVGAALDRWLAHDPADDLYEHDEQEAYDRWIDEQADDDEPDDLDELDEITVEVGDFEEETK